MMVCLVSSKGVALMPLDKNGERCGAPMYVSRASLKICNFLQSGVLGDEVMDDVINDLERKQRGPRDELIDELLDTLSDDDE